MEGLCAGSRRGHVTIESEDLQPEQLLRTFDAKSKTHYKRATVQSKHLGILHYAQTHMTTLTTTERFWYQCGMGRHAPFNLSSIVAVPPPLFKARD